MDNYEKLEQIGRGAFGDVYKIRRKSDQKLFVWKEIDYSKMNHKER